MTKELINIKTNNQPTLTSLEVAEMMGMKHYQILEKLEGTKKSKGIIKTLNDHKIMVVDYFIKTTYRDTKGETRPCYLLTKMGCEFLANKFTGEKGILFTAKYVKKFNEMEQNIKVDSYMISDPIARAKAWIKEEEVRIELAETIEKQKPLVEFAETCKVSKDNLLVREVAKIISKQGFKIGEKKLYSKLREWGVIMKNGTEPYQRAVDNGYIEVEENYKRVYGEVRLFKTSKITPKGQIYIINKLRKEAI